MEKKPSLETSNSSAQIAVSIIIPLYNAEKFIGETLDSIFEQTFKNFEVVIVDDCSTDSSCEIVESYIPKFDGRLSLYHTFKNSGSGAIARNLGLDLSRGEYIFNMDNDDKLVKTALEEMYTFAKEYDADVVYCEKYYESDSDGNNIQIKIWQKGELVDKPTLESEDLKERVQNIINDRYWVVPWSKMVRRKFVLDNKIFFPPLNISDDNIWNQGLVFYAKRFLRVPNPVYIYRLTEKSILRIEKTSKVRMNFWLRPILLGLKYLDDLMSRHEFFKENPLYRHYILKKFIIVRFSWIFSSSKKLSEDVIYETIKEEFSENLGEYDVVISAICAHIFEQNKALVELQRKLRKADIIAEKDKKRIAELQAENQKLKSRLAPAISVIIPLYNAEEYIGECLESLLIQAFQDFEVIVVDDCSTDNSLEIVKKYAPKFNKRLQITQTEKNSKGGGYVPRNIGFNLAKGEYIFFVDADDFLLGSALETLYTEAKKHNADLVYTAAHYKMTKPNDVYLNRDGKGKELTDKGLEDKTKLTVDKPDKILHLLIFEKGFTTSWTHFVKRDFLLKNKITFPEIPKAGDYIWAINSYCHAKRFLRLTTPVYVYRPYNVNSVSQSKQSDKFFDYISSFVAFAKTLINLSNDIEILRNNPNYCYQASKRYFEWCLNRTNDTRKKLTSQDIYKMLNEELNNGSNNLFEAAVPFFFAIIDGETKDKVENLQTIKNLKKEIAQFKKPTP